MRRPIQSITDTGNGSPRRQALIVGSVVALHALLGYAIVTGLAQRIVLEAPNILTAEVLPQQDVPPPPPQPLPREARYACDAVGDRRCRCRSSASRPRKPAHGITVVQGPPRPVTPAQRVVVAPPVPAAEPAPAIAPTAARSVAGTHTIPPYPDLARHLGESGTVRLQIAIDEAGTIRAVGDRAFERQRAAGPGRGGRGCRRTGAMRRPRNGQPVASASWPRWFST